MAEPKKRLTSTRSGNRRSHLAKKVQKLGFCPKCNSALPSHTVCKKCGYYNGEDILQLERKEREKKERRKAESDKNE